MTIEMQRPRHIRFAAVSAACLAHLPELLATWLPDGRRVGNEWVARNPRRDDRRPGSFKINMRTGRWGDFATGDAGGDVVGLYAYLNGLGQIEAARELMDKLGVAR
ncbi:hypothetical protein C2I36_15415 [Rhodobacteraceae bacterium WD3A24]|nr:hypothetical protein C2I36_15415 [Rhodobacteraceae bacterium WD3A24]